jgi:rod shape determining protein RodA
VTGMVVGRYRPTRSAIVMRVVAKKGLRQFDWLLIGVAIALTVIGTLLIWSATAPALEQAGLDPRMYLKKQVLNASIGVVLMFITACIDYRRYRAATPLLYVLSLLLLLAVLTPAGTTVNGAKAWIALPGGFQVEPSEFAKLAVVLTTALIMSYRRGVGGCVC